MIIHELKTINPYFTQIWLGMKTFEIRYNDRSYNVGDFLLLKEYNPNNLTMKYSFREILCEVTSILRDKYMLGKGYVVMSIKIIKKMEK